MACRSASTDNGHLQHSNAPANIPVLSPMLSMRTWLLSTQGFAREGTRKGHLQHRRMEAVRERSSNTWTS